MLLEAEIAHMRVSLKGTNDESAVLKGQMSQLSSSVIKLAEKERAVVDQLDKAREAVRAREGEIAVLKERVAQLVDDGACAACTGPLPV